MGYQLGIDLGSAHIVVAVSDDSWPQVLSLGGSSETPSAIFVSPGEELHFGRAAERRAAADPDRAARGFLRRLGDPSPFLLGGAAYTAEALVARTVSWAVATATRIRGEAPTHVTVAHPAFWSDYRRALFADAVARVDAVDVPITVCSAAEAVAGLLTRRGHARPGAFVGFYDLGAGSFDAAVLAALPNGFQQAGEAVGFNHGAGADFDDAVLTHTLRALGAAAKDLDPSDPAAAAALDALRKECSQAKEVLSEEDSVDIPVALPGAGESVRLTREEFESLIRPTVDDTVRAFERALRSVPASSADLTMVVLHGGSTRIPLVGQTLAAAFGDTVRQEFGSYADIALGAALVASGAAAPEVSPVVTAIIDPPEPRSVPSIPISGPPMPISPLLPPGSAAPTQAGGPAVPMGGPAVPLGGPAALAGAASGAGHSTDDTLVRFPPDAVGPTPPAASGAHAGMGAPGAPGGLPAFSGPAAQTEPPTPLGPRSPRLAPGRSRLIAAAAVLVVLAGAGTTIGLLATSGDSDPTPTPSPVIDAGGDGEHGHPTEPADGANVVLAPSSDVVAPILETAYNEFRGEQGGVTVRTETTTTDDAFAKLCSGEADIIGASYALDAATMDALGDPECIDRVAEFEVAHHTIPVIVNPGNTFVDCLTRAQLQSIWKQGSTITRWSQIDPDFPDEPVTFFGPPADSVHATVFNDDINGAPDNHREYREVDLDAVAQSVAVSANSMGFLDFVNYETAGARVRGVDLDNGDGCTPPNAITAGTGAYSPLCKPLWVYASKDALREPATAAFVNFYLPRAQDIATKAHYVPRSDATTQQNVDLAGELTAGVDPVES